MMSGDSFVAQVAVKETGYVQLMTSKLDFDVSCHDFQFRIGLQSELSTEIFVLYIYIYSKYVADRHTHNMISAVGEATC